MRMALGWLPIVAFAAVGCTGEDSTDRIRTLCGEHLNVSEEICACIGDRAGTELSAEGRDLVAALLGGDEERAQELRADLDLDEITRAAMFVASAPAACVAEQAGGGS